MHAISIERREPESTVPFVRVVEPEPGRSAERTVAAALAHLLMMFGVKHGLDPTALCAAAGFQTTDLADRDRQVPYAWFAALARELNARVPNVCLAAEVARFAVLDQFGYLGQAIKHADTPLGALQLLARYGRWLDSTLQSHELAVVREGDSVHFIVPEVSSERRAWTEALLAGALSVLRALGSRDLTPREIRFARGPIALHPELSALFDAPVSFAWADNRLVFDRAALEQPANYADSHSTQHFCAQVNKLVDDLDEPFVTLVHRAIATQLTRGDLSQRRIGRCLALSPRSLQRKLHQHGLKYTTLVHETRKSVAARLLLDPAHSVGEVANAVGYQDVSSFTRMFKRWTGLSPRTYRDRQRALSVVM
ncbi:MAG TPA: AraC family transcriptional regulator ligand-binding domain-containing protein [Polyangiales bacterium]|nr:AraC family transcriptional regulator ligand-binding domain-containing protein [Polyangiales bacterium]